MKYSEANTSLLLKLTTESFLQRGVDIQFLSAFPQEAEVLFPPLTYLQPTGKQADITEGSRTLVICEVRPIINSTGT